MSSPVPHTQEEAAEERRTQLREERAAELEAEAALQAADEVGIASAWETICDDVGMYPLALDDDRLDILHDVIEGGTGQCRVAGAT